jgi:DNA-binding SARP family transcriptional activator
MTAKPEIPYEQILQRLPSGALVADLAGRIVFANAAAKALLGPALARPGVHCCDVFGCRVPGTALADACITELALRRETPTPEIRVETPVDGEVPASVWLTAAAVGGVDSAVVLQIRSALSGDRRRRTEPHWIAGSTLRIHTLGRTRLESGEAPLAGEWLAHRPGELLKYLTVARDRVVPLEELHETFWPEGSRTSATNVRQAIHTLRDRLEPNREKHRPSSFVAARKGGYELDSQHVWIDADDFESFAKDGIDAAHRRDPGEAEQLLQDAAALYRGDFLADEPYAEWALTERERLRDLAAQVLRVLAGLRLDRADAEGALEPLQRLAELEPFDDRCQRDLLEQLLRLGRHAEAKRRYELIRRRFRRAFGTDPDWALDQLQHA